MASFSDLLQQLIETVPADSFNSSNLKDLDVSRDDYWKEILEYMKTSNLPLLEKEFGSGSVFDYIQKNADLNNDLLDKLLSKITEGGVLNNLDLSTESGLKAEKKDYFWNESVSKALAYFTRHFYPEVQNEIEDTGFVEGDMTVSVPNGSIPVNGEVENFRIKDVKKADAGRSFSSNGKWVSPWYNINANTYKKVRGNDLINSVVSNSSELQFTRNPASGDGGETNFQWIRLIMPKYLRNVEVEDLNRNFWVTAQVLTAISAYLFGDESPITEMFKKLLNEIVQLWENILYLWVAMAILSQKQYYTDVHTEVLYLPNDSIRNFLKFDDFATHSDFTLSPNLTETQLVSLLKTIWNRLSYLKEDYTTSHLCLIPCIRNGNYYKNYYSSEYYPGIILYNRNSETLKYIPFLLNNKVLVVDSSDNDITNAIGTIREFDFQYSYIVPYNLVEDSVDQEVNRYYSLIRTIPEITATYSKETEQIEFNNFQISLYDVASMVAHNKNEDKFLTFSGAAGNENSQNIVITKSGLLNGKKSNYTSPEVTRNIDIKKGYYQGELISNYKLNKIPSNYEFTIQRYDGIPVENSMELVYQTIKDYASKDNVILEKLVNPSQSFFTLYTMRHYCNFWSDHVYVKQEDGTFQDEEGNTYQPSEYYDIDEKSLLKKTTIFEEEVEIPDEEDETADPTIITYAKNHHSDDFNCSACVWNPITQSIHFYPNYQRYTIQPSYLLSNLSDTNTVAGGSFQYTIIYKQDKFFTESNWCIKYIEISGGWVNPADNKVTAEELTYSSDFKLDNYEEMRFLVTRVYVHLFSGSGDYERKVLSRYAFNDEFLRPWSTEDRTAGFDRLDSTLTEATLFSSSSPLRFDLYPVNGRDR